ncbi:MAG: hypothetical protein UR26_C0006G0044 [candidate division TM6 bacterium GW2011_GWF2_32_72]|nr:MAG: hypothetical protein UR26_C0006G0044 [candidate division TM6 bacterium GW2011_GWF2_32_72]
MKKSIYVSLLSLIATLCLASDKQEKMKHVQSLATIEVAMLMNKHNNSEFDPIELNKLTRSASAIMFQNLNKCGRKTPLTRKGTPLTPNLKRIQSLDKLNLDPCEDGEADRINWSQTPVKNINL